MKMNITRRSFVKATTTAAIGASIIGTTGFRTMAQQLSANDLFPIPPESTTDPLNYLTREHFVPFVDSVMSVQGTSGKAISVRLTEAADLTNSVNEKKGYVGASYSLIFEPLRKAPMPADTYRFRHETLGDFSLTILPVGQSGRSRQALVNRIAQKN
jgi:hypothetical protein